MNKNGVFFRIKDKFCSFLKKDKKNYLIIIVCFVVIMLLFLSSIIPKKNNNKSNNLSDVVSVTEYADKIENKLKSIISKLDSVVNVDVFVMIDATPKITYLTEKKESTVTNESGSTSEITTTVVFEKNGSIQTPVVVTTIMPKVTGVLIITNKLDVSTKLLIKNSISIVLNIDESCISILQEK